MVLSASFLVSPANLFLGLIGLGVTIFCIVDVARRPEWAWSGSGQSKVLWLVLTIVALFFGLIGLIISGIYLFVIRPKVAVVQNQGGPMGGRGFGPGPMAGGGFGPGSSSSYGASPSYGPAPDAGYGSAGGSSFGAAPGAGYGQSSGNDPSGAGWALPSSSPPPPPGSPSAGWYPDPGGSGQPRYWNGQSWTEDGPH